MTSSAPSSNSSKFPEIAKLAIDNKILTEDQVREALHKIAEEKTKGRPLTFEDYLQENRLVSDETLSRLLAATVRHLDKKFGALVVRSGLVDKDIVDKALAAQKKAFAKGVLTPISDILMTWNHLTIRQRDKLLQVMNSPGRDETEPRAETERQQDEPHHPPESSPSMADTMVPKEDIEKDEPEDPMVIHITDQGLEAVLHIRGNLDEKPSLRSVKDLLSDYDISFGIIDDEELVSQLEQAGKDSLDIVVARGLKPVQGKSAEVTLHFNNDFLNPGEITEDGTIDFRERGSVPFVSEDTLLAVKTPAVKGEPGRDVSGQDIPVKEVEDMSFKGGVGTRTSQDGLSIFATTEGQPFMSVQGEVCVFKDLHIKGDVDYSTGNINFDGNIFVKGSVKEGFTIKGGSLTAKDVQGATLSIKGNINISGGIFDSFITLGGSLQAMYMSNTKVDAYGDILLKKEIIDSKIRSSGVFSGEQVDVISSFVSAKQGIDAKRIGTDVSEPCTLRIGISDHTNKIIKNLKANLEHMKKNLGDKQAANEKLKALQQKSQDQIMEKAVAQDKLTQKKTAIENKIQALPQTSENTGEAQELASLLSQINADIKDLDDAVSSLFQQQDQMTNQILAAQEQCEALVRDIEALNIQIRDVKSWDKKTNQRPRLRVSKEIHPPTAIAGPNSTLTVKEILRNVTIHEAKTTVSSGLVWNLIVESN